MTPSEQAIDSQNPRLLRMAREAALQLWHEAWDDSPATHAWCCHHEILLEKLTEPASVRLAYIRGYKPQHEIITRINNFRPASSKVVALYDEYESNQLDLVKEYQLNLRNIFHNHTSNAAVLIHKYLSDRNDLGNEYRSKLEVLYHIEVPLGTWTGNSIF